MKKRKHDIDMICKYCEHSAILHGDDAVLCDKKGVVSADHKCSRFSVDVLRIAPTRTKAPEPLEYIDIDSKE